MDFIVFLPMSGCIAPTAAISRRGSLNAHPNRAKQARVRSSTKNHTNKSFARVDAKLRRCVSLSRVLRGRRSLSCCGYGRRDASWRERRGGGLRKKTKTRTQKKNKAQRRHPRQQRRDTDTEAGRGGRPDGRQRRRQVH